MRPQLHHVLSRQVGHLCALRHPASFSQYRAEPDV
jgi:hypothetical protein